MKKSVHNTVKHTFCYTREEVMRLLAISKNHKITDFEIETDTVDNLGRSTFLFMTTEKMSKEEVTERSAFLKRLEHDTDD